MNQCLYIILCDDDYLYVGITGNIRKRLSEHQNGLCRNTKNRGKIRLVYKEVFSNVHSAAAREKEIKGWRRVKKEALILSACPEYDVYIEKI